MFLTNKPPGFIKLRPEQHWDPFMSGPKLLLTRQKCQENQKEGASCKLSGSRPAQGPLQAV